jgi:Tol biopolymer transport system component
VFVVAIAVSAPSVVVASPGTAQAVEGPLIAFTTDRDGNNEVYVVEAAGGTPVNLTRHPASDHSPTWSPDGARVAFISDRSGDPDVWVMNADGSNPVNTTNSDEVHESEPAWSPQSARVAYSAFIDMSSVPEGNVVFTAGVPSIFVKGAPGGCERITVPYVDPIFADGFPVDPRAVEFTYEAWDDSPAWSPDGEMLAFVRDIPESAPTGQSSHIYVVPPEGTTSGSSYCPWNETYKVAPTLVGEGGWDATGLEWSRDGGSLLFASASSDGLRSTLRRLDVATGVVSDIVPPLGFSHYAGPALSADGASLAFEAYDGDQGFGDIYVWPTDGTSAPRRLTTNPASDSDPAWQPPPPWFPPVGLGLVDTNSGRWKLLEHDRYRWGDEIVSELREYATEVRFYYGNPGDSPFMGDWTCDGTDTPGLYRRSDGYVYLRNTNTQGIADTRFFYGDPGDVPIAGDFDGDGCDTVSIYRPSEARFYVINELGEDEGGLGAAEYSFLFGDIGDTPVVGDWDGDGIDEVGLHRETTGFFYYRNTLTTGAADGQFYFGEPGDRFVSGDWGLADGLETLAAYRSSTETFYFRHALTQGLAHSEVVWDGPGSDPLPVSGDFALD